MPQHQPRVSVIMAVYNCEDYVAESIRSVQSQTVGDWELICVDDASTDASAEVVQRLAQDDPRITLIRQETNQGPAAARNRAIAEATGRFIAVLDSDDIAPPRRLEISLKAFEEDPELGLVGGQHVVIGPDGEVRERVERPVLADEQFESVLSRQSMPMPHSSCMIRRELLERIGGYDERLPASQDYDMVLRLSPHCRCLRLDECLLHYRQRPGQISEDRCFAQSLYAEFAFARACARLDNRSFDEQQHLEHIQSRLCGRHGLCKSASMRLRGLALRAAHSGDYARFRELIGRSLAYWPFSLHTLFWRTISLMPKTIQARSVNLWNELRPARDSRNEGAHNQPSITGKRSETNECEHL